MCIRTIACAAYAACLTVIAAGSGYGASAPASQANGPGHPLEFWRELRVADFKLDDAARAPALANEAATLLGSVDPELRDEIAYEAIADWVYRDQLLQPAQLEALRARLSENAVYQLGTGDDDSLFLRSFSLLALSVLAAEDLRRPFLDRATFDAMLALGLQALARERDLRGYVSGKGWGHATAHTADLLKFLARNPMLTLEQQRQVVDGIAQRLQSAGQVFVWGEDARLAAALAAIARRADSDPQNFAHWLDTMRAQHSKLWSGTLDPALYVQERAQLNALAQLGLNLDIDGSAPAVRALLQAAAKELL
jgi:hypothetical protein